MTNRFAESVARLAQMLPIKQVAELFRLSWDTVKVIDRAALAARVGSVDLTGVRQIAIDEVAIQKGHRYATSLANPVTTKVLWWGAAAVERTSRPSSSCSGRRRAFSWKQPSWI
jgi:transposase